MNARGKSIRAVLQGHHPRQPRMQGDVRRKPRRQIAAQADQIRCFSRPRLIGQRKRGPHRQQKHRNTARKHANALRGFAQTLGHSAALLHAFAFIIATPAHILPANWRARLDLNHPRLKIAHWQSPRGAGMMAQV